MMYTRKKGARMDERGVSRLTLFGDKRYLSVALLLVLAVARQDLQPAALEPLDQSREKENGSSSSSSSSSMSSVQDAPVEIATPAALEEAVASEAINADTAATTTTPIESTVGIAPPSPPPGGGLDESSEAAEVAAASEKSAGVEMSKASEVSRSDSESEVESRTAQLSKRVGEEASSATTRAQRMVDLSSELGRSFAKKEEVERIIASEIAQLSRKLQQERDIEISREADLRGLVREFDEAIVEKQELIETEQDLLAQMQALREQVKEPSIRTPIEGAMAKKADVTSIEVMLLEDLVECREKLEEELRSTSSRADTMNGVAAALPSEESDAARMRAYNWRDVQDLQEVLLSSVESMEASDAQVASLRTKLLDAVRQKRQVLGEASSTEIVAGGADGGAKKMSLARAFEVSKEFTEEELLRMAAESSTSAVVGVAKSVAAGVSSLGNYAKSPDAQDVAASTVDVVAAISGAASAIRDAFREAKKEFDEKSTPSEELTSFDKIMVSLQSGFKAAVESSAVKAKLDEAGGLVTTQLPEAGRRVGEGAAKALKGAAANEEIGNPVREALDSAEKFVVSMAALGSRWFNNPKAAYFQLTGGESSEKNKNAAVDDSPVEESPSPRLQGASSPAEAETGTIEGVAGDGAPRVAQTGPADAKLASPES